MNDKGTLQCYNKKKLKQDVDMSRRWFDLLATIGFACYFFLSCSVPYYIATNKIDTIDKNYSFNLKLTKGRAKE